jgi:hypothetical protein
VGRSVRSALSERNENVIDEIGTGGRCRTEGEARTVVLDEDGPVVVTVRDEDVLEGTVVTGLVVLLVNRVAVDADDDGVVAVREIFGVEHIRMEIGEAGSSLR